MMKRRTNNLQFDTSKKKSQKVVKFFWFILLCSLWEVVTQLELFEPMLLPKLSSVVIKLADGLVRGDLLLQSGQSILLVLCGIILAAIVSIILVYLDYFYPILRSLIELLATILHPLPGIALLPVVILWFGVGLKAVFIVIFHGILWSFYLNVKLGVNSVDKALVEVAQNNGSTKIQLFRYVLIPCSRDAFFAGAMIGWSRGWRSLISAEMIFGAISSLGGIGWYLVTRRAFGDIQGTYAGIVIVALIGIMVEEIVFKGLKKY